MGVDVWQEHISAGCNRVTNALDWGPDGLLAYGAHNSVLLYDPEVMARLFYSGLTMLRAARVIAGVVGGCGETPARQRARAWQCSTAVEHKPAVLTASTPHSSPHMHAHTQQKQARRAVAGAPGCRRNCI